MGKPRQPRDAGPAMAPIDAVEYVGRKAAQATADNLATRRRRGARTLTVRVELSTDLAAEMRCRPVYTFPVGVE